MMSGGNWMPELIAAAGGDNLFGEAGKHSGYMTFAELASADPDVIIVAPCGFDIARTMQEMPLSTCQPGWRNLAAVRNGRVAVADGNLYFNRPSPGLAQTTEIIAEIIHGAGIDFGHRGRGWVALRASLTDICAGPPIGFDRPALCVLAFGMKLARTARCSVLAGMLLSSGCSPPPRRRQRQPTPAELDTPLFRPPGGEDRHRGPRHRVEDLGCLDQVRRRRDRQADEPRHCRHAGAEVPGRSCGARRRRRQEAGLRRRLEQAGNGALHRRRARPVDGRHREGAGIGAAPFRRHLRHRSHSRSPRATRSRRSRPIARSSRSIP